MEGSEASEPRARFKRRQLSLANTELREKEEKLQKLRLVNHYRQNVRTGMQGERFYCCFLVYPVVVFCSTDFLIPLIVSRWFN